MNVDLRPFSLSLARPLETARGPIERRDGLLVDVQDGDVRGTGEATPLPGWTESLDACRAALEAALDRLRARDPGTVADDRDALLPESDAAPAARHGLDLALADLDARRAGEPLYRRLGAGERVDSVPVNAVVGEGTTGETVAAARAAVDAGFGCLKLKAGTRDVVDDVERVASVRDAVGPDVGIRVDVNGAWKHGEAERAFDALQQLDVEYVEQPLPAEDLDGCSALRGGPVAVALDESLARHGPDAVLEAGAADVLVLKPMVLGGPSRARAVADAARDADVVPVVTTTVDGVVARLGAVHLAASLPEAVPAGLATSDRLAEDLAPDPVTVVDGRASVPQAPGHGVTVEGGST